MDSFLTTHKIDVGKTVGILLIFYAVEEIYKFIFGYLYNVSSTTNLGVPVIVALGIGMFNHRETARLWCLALLWLSVLLLVIITIVTAFIGTESTFFGSLEVSVPPFWKVVLMDLFIAPLPWIGITVLNSKTVRREFSSV